MNKNYLCNEESVSGYPQDATGQTVYAPGEMVIKYTGTEKDVAVPEGIKAIGDDAFSDCETIVTVSLPSSLVWIGHQAFSKCPNLKEITIEEGLEQTHKAIFSELPSLEKVHLPNTLKYMQDRMFVNCASLQTVNIPDKITSIWTHTFSNCPSLKNLFFGAQFTPRAYDFENTPELTQFSVSESNEKIKVLDNIVYSKDGKKLLLARKNIEDCFTVPEGVEVIESYAFAHCKKLTEVVFPSTLYEIEDSAFQGCSELVRVHIPENVKRIGDNAFNRNKTVSGYMKFTDRSLKPFELISIDPAAGASYVGGDVFDFLIPDDKTPLVLPEYPINLVQKDRKVRFLFGYCLNPDKYTEEYAKGYQKAAKMQRKKVVEEANKQGLTGVSAYYASLDAEEDGKKSKQGQSKKKATSAKGSASAKEQPKNTNASISMAEAKKTWKLEPLTFGEGFENSKYYHVDTISLKEYKGNEETVVIPPVIGKKPVSTIGAFAFGNNKTLKHIVIPDCIVSIEDYAFEGCSSLDSVSIEGETISIGSGAFRDCAMLSSFSCKSESVKLGIQPFYGCTRLMDDNGFIILPLQNHKVLCGCKMPIQSKEIIIPEGVERIDGCVFSYGFRLGRTDTDVVKKLRRVVIPDSVKSIAGGTFGAENLQEVVLPKGLEELSNTGVFSNCISLKELHLPSSITKLNPYFVTMQGAGYPDITLYAEEGGYVETFVKENEKYGYKFAVEGTQGLDHQILVDFIVEDGVLERYVGDSDRIEIPDGVKEIGSFVFDGNSKISEVSIPASVIKINEYALSECHSLKKITIPGTVKIIDDSAFASSGLNEVELSNGITEIGEEAFTFCQLKEVTVPGTVKQIGKKAFSYNWTTLKKVVIEPGVEIIGQEAFAGNRMLEEVIIPDSVITIEDKAFSGSENLKKIEIPNRIEEIRDKIF